MAALAPEQPHSFGGAERSCRHPLLTSFFAAQPVSRASTVKYFVSFVFSVFHGSIAACALPLQIRCGAGGTAASHV